MPNNVMLEDHEIMDREPDLERLRHAYSLLRTDHSSAIVELEKLANVGSLMSVLYLADFYARDTNADEEETEKWLKRAYEQGSARGLICLAAHYEKSGKYADAEKLYLNGISSNDGQSKYRLAKLYMKTNRYSIVSPEIRKLLESAAEQGQARAMRDLWSLHIKGVFGVRNIPKGIFLLFYFLSRGFVLSFRRRPDAYGPSDRRLW